jgi:probable addiction module antidote protein
LRIDDVKNQNHKVGLGRLSQNGNAVLEDGDPELVAHALGVVSRSKGMGEIAAKTGLGRESLYKALSSEGNPEMATFLKVIKALGLKLRVAA